MLRTIAFAISEISFVPLIVCCIRGIFNEISCEESENGKYPALFHATVVLTVILYSAIAIFIAWKLLLMQSRCRSVFMQDVLVYASAVFFPVLIHILIKKYKILLKEEQD